MKPRVVQNQEVYHKLEARDKRILLKITYKKKMKTMLSKRLKNKNYFNSNWELDKDVGYDYHHFTLS